MPLIIPPGSGPAGPAGPAGSPGPSAYERAVANGYSGTEAQWLSSLVGAPGPAGAAGPAGPAGRGFQPRGEWDPTLAYSVDDLITKGGSTYRVKTAQAAQVLGESVTDTFDRADGPVGTTSDGKRTWTVGANTTASIVTNRLRTSSGDGQPASVWAPFDKDGTIQVTYATIGNWQGLGIEFRQDANGLGGYQFSGDSGNIYIFRRGAADTAGGTVLGSAATTDFVAGDVAAVVLSGNTITVRKNGVDLLTVVDSTYSSNVYHGLYNPSGVASEFDAFSFTTAGATAYVFDAAGHELWVSPPAGGSGGSVLATVTAVAADGTATFEHIAADGSVVVTSGVVNGTTSGYTVGHEFVVVFNSVSGEPASAVGHLGQAQSGTVTTYSPAVIAPSFPYNSDPLAYNPSGEVIGVDVNNILGFGGGTFYWLESTNALGYWNPSTGENGTTVVPPFAPTAHCYREFAGKIWVYTNAGRAAYYDKATTAWVEPAMPAQPAGAVFNTQGFVWDALQPWRGSFGFPTRVFSSPNFSIYITWWDPTANAGAGGWVQEAIPTVATAAYNISYCKVHVKTSGTRLYLMVVGDPSWTGKGLGTIDAAVGTWSAIVPWATGSNYFDTTGYAFTYGRVHDIDKTLWLAGKSDGSTFVEHHLSATVYQPDGSAVAYDFMPRTTAVAGDWKGGTSYPQFWSGPTGKMIAGCTTEDHGNTTLWTSIVITDGTTTGRLVKTDQAVGVPIIWKADDAGRHIWSYSTYIADGDLF